MANITEDHLHHMARRHHATMKKLDGIRERSIAVAERFFGTFEIAGGSWLGGAIEGKFDGATVLKVPVNLGIGAALLAVSHFNFPNSHWSGHLSNLGNGFIGSYLAATGYAFGKRWKDTGKLLGGGGHPWTHPYDTAPAPAVQGDLSEAQMAAIVQRMQQAAGAPAHP